MTEQNYSQCAVRGICKTIGLIFAIDTVHIFLCKVYIAHKVYNRVRRVLWSSSNTDAADYATRAQVVCQTECTGQIVSGSGGERNQGIESPGWSMNFGDRTHKANCNNNKLIVNYEFS